ncbi:hypothetical protein [Pseudonocardia sp.]|jgi:hypothetical protein|uniref:hypothetical protein n=1 Tax=Pseudonocardia sp. TaxID=60912 RepID=UPI002DAF17FC|nr:hypothetical protein [Pseudonocardia sp.]
MKTVYRVLAYLVALAVVIQAATIAFAVFGLLKWIDDGGVLDRAATRSGPDSFTGASGFVAHGTNGQMIVPILAVLLLVVSFFAKVQSGVVWAGAVLLTVVVEVVLGTFAHALPELGILHGILAIALFAIAVIAARQAEAAAPREAEPAGTGRPNR